MKLFEKINAKFTPSIQGRASGVGVKAAKLDPQRVPVSPAGSSNARAAGTVQQLAAATAPVMEPAALEVSPVPLGANYYTGLVNELHHTTYAHIEAEITELNAKISRLGERIQPITPIVRTVDGYVAHRGPDKRVAAIGKGSPDNAQAKLIEASRKLAAKRDVLQRELDKIKFENMPEIDLTIHAQDLDQGYMVNRAGEMFGKIVRQLEAVVPNLNEAARCYGGEFYEPIELTELRRAILKAIGSYNNPTATGLHIRHIDHNKTLGSFLNAYYQYKRKIEAKKALETELVELN